MKLEELEKIARAATPGPWEINAKGQLYQPDTKDDLYCYPVWINCDARGNDGHFIATFNPETVLKLLSKLKRYEEALKFYANENHFDHLSVLFYCDVDGIQREGGGFAVVDDGIIERGTVAKKALEDTK